MVHLAIVGESSAGAETRSTGVGVGSSQRLAAGRAGPSYKARRRNAIGMGIAARQGAGALAGVLSGWVQD